jgi:hypothetical protein
MKYVGFIALTAWVGWSTGGCGRGASWGPAPAGVRPLAQTAASESPPMRRLTTLQYRNVIHSVFGPDVPVPATFSTDLVQGGFSSLGAVGVGMDDLSTRQCDAAAWSIATLVTTAERRERLGCVPTLDLVDSCTRQLIRLYGQRLWRRPLTLDELLRYGAVAHESAQHSGDPWEGVATAFAALLQSPHFLFRVESMRVAAEGAIPDIDDYALASRLSFLLWNDGPDEALLNAAAQGQLTTASGVLVQARRLMADARWRGGLNRFLSELLNLDAVPDLARDPNLFPHWSSELAVTMQRSLLLTLDDLLIGREASFRELFVSRVTYVDGELANLYGMPTSGGNELVEAMWPASDRAGLLGHAAILAVTSQSDSTSPTRRGKYIRERLLCQGVPPPPPNVPALPPAIAAGGPQTMRQRLEQHRADPNCAACHSLMDPMGLPLEHFDAMGQYRATDRGLPLDTSGELDGVRFIGLNGLSQALHASDRALDCLPQQLFTYALARTPTRRDAAELGPLRQAFRVAGYRLSGLIEALVTAPAFRSGLSGQETGR